MKNTFFKENTTFILHLDQKKNAIKVLRIMRIYENQSINQNNTRIMCYIFEEAFGK